MYYNRNCVKWGFFGIPFECILWGVYLAGDLFNWNLAYTVPAKVRAQLILTEDPWVSLIEKKIEKKRKFL